MVDSRGKRIRRGFTNMTISQAARARANLTTESIEIAAFILYRRHRNQNAVVAPNVVIIHNAEDPFACDCRDCFTQWRNMLRNSPEKEEITEFLNSVDIGIMQEIEDADAAEAIRLRNEWILTLCQELGAAVLQGGISGAIQEIVAAIGQAALTGNGWTLQSLTGFLMRGLLCAGLTGFVQGSVVATLEYMFGMLRSLPWSISINAMILVPSFVIILIGWYWLSIILSALRLNTGE